MAKVSEVIKELQELEEQNGNVELTIFHSIDKKTYGIETAKIHYDEGWEDIYIEIKEGERKKIKEV